MRVVMIGTGYVGLVSGTCFADFGHFVTCVDKDSSKIDALNNGEVPIFEPGFDALIERNVAQGRLTFTTDLKSVASQADVIFIAVGTPTRRGDGHADLSYVYGAAEELVPMLDGYTVVVTKSTVPVGTGDEVEKILRENAPNSKFDVASNPEFLREGAAISDFKRPDRVVCGAETDEAFAVLQNLYRPLFLNETPIVETSRRTAEMIKYAANAFLAVKISFINEIADVCEKAGSDVQQVAKAIGLDKRIGSKFLNAGPGYGGSCFPKDTMALSKTAADLGVPVTIVDAVIESNSNRKKSMVTRIVNACGGDVKGKTVAVLGLTFKPNTDDMRDSPSLDIIPGLQGLGATINANDPEGHDEAKKCFENVNYFENAYECAAGADVTVIVTEWDQFRALDLNKIKSEMSGDALVDLRNIYRRDEVEKAGFRYFCIGK